MNEIGIVPAAGVGSRWGHYPKFLLPCGDKEWLLDRAIKAMPCEKVVVVFRKEVVSLIVNHLAETGLSEKVVLVEQTEKKDIYGAMLAAMKIDADYYYFGMPDTYWPKDVFKNMKEPGITLGLHRTELPERFGMLRNGTIVNKQMGEPGLAWGTLGWDKEVRELWMTSALETYTDAINLAMQECKWHQVEMEYYHDMANFESYVDFLRSIRAKKES